MYEDEKKDDKESGRVGVDLHLVEQESKLTVCCLVVTPKSFYTG